MAKPIKQTPTLYGKDAERFLAQIKENETKKATPEEMARMKASYEAMERILEKRKK